MRMKMPDKAQNPPISFPSRVLGLSSYPDNKLIPTEEFDTMGNLPTVVMVMSPHQKALKIMLKFSKKNQFFKSLTSTNVQP